MTTADWITSVEVQGRADVRPVEHPPEPVGLVTRFEERVAFTNAAHEGYSDLNTLTGRLRMLEAEGRAHRHYEPTVPPRVTYSLTDKVMELDGVLRELVAIADGWYGRRAKKPG